MSLANYTTPLTTKSRNMCNYEKIVHSCGHVVPGKLWYCSASNNRQNHIYKRCCRNSFTKSHHITDTSDRLCDRCERLHIRAQEQWQHWNSPICITSTGRYTILPSRLGPWGYVGVWLRNLGFAGLSEYFTWMGFVLAGEIASDQTRWEEDGFATPTWHLKYPHLAKRYPVTPGPFSSDVDLLWELQRFRW